MVKGRTYEFRVKTSTGNWVGWKDACQMIRYQKWGTDSLHIRIGTNDPVWGTINPFEVILRVGDQVTCVGHIEDYGKVPIIRTQDGREFKIFAGEEKYFKWVR